MMKSLEDVLVNYSFHDSVIKEIYFLNNKNNIAINIQLPKNDFSDTFLECVIEYINITLKEISLDISEIDWSKIYGSVLSYKKEDNDVYYFIELTNPGDVTEYLKIIFSAERCLVHYD